jgi:hypothetical protein
MQQSKPARGWLFSSFWLVRRRLLGDYRMLRQTQLMFERNLGMTPAFGANLVP